MLLYVVASKAAFRHNMEHEKPSPSPARVYDPACLIKDCKVSVTKSTQANGSNKQLLPTPTVFGRCVVAVGLASGIWNWCYWWCAFFGVHFLLLFSGALKVFHSNATTLLFGRFCWFFPTRCLDKWKLLGTIRVSDNHKNRFVGFAKLDAVSNVEEGLCLCFSLK